MELFRTDRKKLRNGLLLSTNWDEFTRLTRLTNVNLELNVPLKSGEDIEKAVEHFNHVIQKAEWSN